MSRRIDLTGQVFGRLTAIQVSSTRLRGQLAWDCSCLCGAICSISVDGLRGGHTKSCGCLRKDAWVRIGKARATHGQAKRGGNTSPEYRSWRSMKYRCSASKKPTDVQHYQNRNITVCERWINSFENFLEDMGSRPSPKHSIDRIDNNIGYSPENCRWATPKEQANNRTNNIVVTIGDETLPLAAWLAKSWMSRSTFDHRTRKLGMTPQEALTIPQIPRGKKKKGHAWPRDP